MPHPDWVLYHAKIYTVDAGFSVYEAVAIRKGRIVAVGSDEELLRAFPRARRRDLHGACVYPGLVDAHAHLEPLGEGLFEAELAGAGSLTGMVDRVKAFAAARPAGAPGTRTHWVLGRGWDQNTWSPIQMPDRALLDAAFPDRPVFLRRVDIHAAVVNAAALRLAGIDPDMPLPEGLRNIAGGEMAVDAAGRPTGLLVDEGQTPVRKLIPEATKADREGYVLAAARECMRHGLTGVGDAYLDLPQIQLFDEMQKAGKLPLRINGMIPATQANLDFILSPAMRRQHDYRTTDRLRLESFKLFSDGALGSRGAWLLAPYSDKPDTTGIPMLEREETLAIARQVYKARKQLCTHAIGDAAARFVLDLYAEVLKGPNDLRWRMEHAQLVHPDDLQRFAQYSIVPSVQPTHPTSDHRWLPDRLGPERLAYSCKLETFRQLTGRVPIGSDFPVEGVNPLLGFYAAITRQDVHGNPSGGFLPAEKLSRPDALRGLTLWNAWAEHREPELGSIAPGKQADLTVLDTDLLTCEPAALLNAQALGTMIGGEWVYEAPAFAP